MGACASVVELFDSCLREFEDWAESHGTCGEPREWNDLWHAWVGFSTATAQGVGFIDYTCMGTQRSEESACGKWIASGGETTRW